MIWGYVYFKKLPMWMLMYFNVQLSTACNNYKSRRSATVKLVGCHPDRPRSTMKWAWFASLLCRSRNAQTPVLHAMAAMACVHMSVPALGWIPKHAIFMGKRMLDHGMHPTFDVKPHVSGKIWEVGLSSVFFFQNGRMLGIGCPKLVPQTSPSIGSILLGVKDLTGHI